uniref:Uncharacterized protein n=1 Tax=Utricularia reniformis TaxID=192314 RepID=A0A1Y0B252_9LAMI|nr:hypothetical protein AEK19_MT1328 [Utricularia reniformis]ART31526.1 hypothetical protein AEK19_MT1328 [Utricularia reniformis]
MVSGRQGHPGIELLAPIDRGILFYYSCSHCSIPRAPREEF